MDIFTKTGIVPVINAVGTMTALGGSRLNPKAMEAMSSVSQLFVDLHELLDAASARVAELTRAPAAFICTGAAAGLSLSAAACITETDPEKILQLPDTQGLKNEIIIDRSHDNPFVYSIKVPGARVVKVGSIEKPMQEDQLRENITDKTAGVFYFAGWAGEQSMSLESVIEISHSRGIPVVVDAAAQLPPVENLWNYHNMGADLVLFSGGKDIRGPQTSGFILGKKDLIEACKLNSSPHESSVCRPMKVSKEDIVGLVAALEDYLDQDFDENAQRYEDAVAHMHSILSKDDRITVYRVCPSPLDIQPNTIPRLYVDFKPSLGISKLEFAQKLKNGTPRLLTAITETGISLNPQTLTSEEVSIVVSRILEELDALS